MLVYFEEIFVGLFGSDLFIPFFMRVARYPIVSDDASYAPSGGGVDVLVR